MRFTSPASILATAALLTSTLLSSSGAFAAPAASAPVASAAAPAGAPAAEAPADPNLVVATVDGGKITLGEIRQSASNMPAQLRQLPPNMIFPMLVNQAVDQKAIQIVAHKANLQADPEVKAAMDTAANNALQTAWLSRQVTPQLTDAAIHDYYLKNYANKAPEKEVHARHILVKTEAEAQDVIKKLKAGDAFGPLAEKLSIDKGSARNNGGDLGWFKKGDMVPVFSDAAFAMKPNTFSETPVKSQFGYHVIQVLDIRTAAVPKEDEVKDKIRQQLIQQDVRAAVEKATSQVKIVRYGPDGKAIPDNAQPAMPGAPAAAPKK
ncbi:peptidylprolyl isomerase [Acetobacter fallax]|uniref:Parvulin-like PPIase n=1 Tax=Acetobacter fallax TaxID=1737473 RepID=A0ABX0KAU0_9PROT|nr:peptidylprolyl isomerase [Acetobacter fallax]NHO33547.1 peptidylprolyl isomerase [Acetobacter fallax]NHO36516.1 peptidylprolyl isomerase [Acetobacter fallax]